MTLPFRRRHHDAESGHDRARALWSDAMIEPIDGRDAQWLERHLAGCAECRAEQASQLTDRSLLRSLRDQPVEPPRDLWARTSAAIERDAARQSRGGRSRPTGGLVPNRARLPLGALAGVLVALVVVAVSFAPNAVPPTALGTPAGGAASNAPVAAASPIEVKTAPLTYVQTAADGSIQVIHANIDEVCPTEKSGCAPLQENSQSALTFGSAQEALVESPRSDQLVVAPRSGGHAGSVLVVPVPTPIPTRVPGSGSPSATPPAIATPTAIATAGGSTTPATPPSTATPTGSPTGSAGPTPLPTPEGARSIAEGVVVVGEARYSPHGDWLAFSAAPIDGSTGPDLYLWNGTDSAAIAVTHDHATYFSSWLGDEVLASRLVEEISEPGASPSSAPGAASAAPPASIGPSPAPATAAPASARPSGVPTGSPVAGPIMLVEHPISFVLDPATHAITDLARRDVWMPAVDTTRRFVTYWSGTLLGGPGTNGIQLGAGHLVLDGWLAPLAQAAGATPGAGASAGATPGASANAGASAGGTATEGPTASGSAAVGPAGTPVELSPGPIGAFEARFDPTGTRLAVWVSDPADPTVGTLRLIVLDRAGGRLAAGPSPLPSVRALQGVSIDQGRVAWVSPPGQNGNQSTVQVLAWAGDEFGQVQTVPGEQLTIVH